MDLIYMGIAIVLLLIPPWLATARRGVGPRGFTEADRWRDSMFTPYGKKIEDDDDSSSSDDD
ncbi:MAG TPA: hypothetical protein VHU41_03155, partial [Thermoanaerobaculia bacterium]|jgi:hypothetical protein|nr:hypothetical protein [Thermoanaerobaculia bacterium]